MDDQVKYSDLFDAGIIGEVQNLTNEIKALQTAIAAAKNEANGLRDGLRGAGTATREQQQQTSSDAAAVEALNRQVKDLTDKLAKLEERKKRYSKLTDQEAASVEALRQALAGEVQEQIKATQAIDIQSKSYNELYQTYNALKDALNRMTVAERENTAAGKAMVNQAKEIRDTLNNLQQQTGNYTLNVGNYMSALNGLQFQAQQLMREIPSAQNLTQFFLAISNNIPMFTDALTRYNKGLPEARVKLAAVTAEIARQEAAMAGMNAQTSEYAAKQQYVNALKRQEIALQGATVNGWRAILKVVGSWQTLLIAGLLLLRKLPDLLKDIGKWFSNMTKEAKMLFDVNNAAASSIGNMTAKYVAMQKEWRNLKDEDMDEWIKQHKDDWYELGVSIDDAKKAEDFYVNNTAAVKEAINERARSIAAMKLATEKYEEAFKKQVEAESAVDNNSASGWNRVKQIFMGYGAFNNGWTRGYLEKTIKKDAESYAEDLRKEAEALREEAIKLITDFVLPEESKPTEKKKKKEPKDQVADLLTLQRQLEDAIIGNIEDEFEREEAAEIARHNRFIEDKQKELALVKNDPERTAVINKQIEEEQNTHDKNMLDIDEKYRQIIQKRVEDEKKKREQEEKENFKREEKEFKEMQEIEKRKFELTKHTATEEKKFVMEQQMELLKWRMDHAKALGISDDMLEVMREEFRQMQEQYAKGNYSNGKQNIKGNYTSLMDILFPGWDNDQKNALDSVFDQAKAALNSWMDARKAAADQAKQLADDEVSAAENALNREIELRNQGYANDVALREKELADAKDAQRRAAEEQKKVAQEQILLDAAMQTSSMITASANILKQFPNPAAWIPMMAAMWGAFAYAKVKAYQASTKSIKFKEGGVMLLEGGSHESGHDVNLGIGPDGSNLRAEGGEYFAVINKRSSRKYGSAIPAVVNALNSGMFEDRYIKTSDAVGLLPRIIRADDGSTVDLSAVESGVGQLVKQGESRWTVEGEYRVERYKNRVRRVRLN